MCQTGNTTEEPLEPIHKHDLVLLSMLKEFVWPLEQVFRLYDRLMRKIPLGPLLYRKVAPESGDEFNFYGFVAVREHHFVTGHFGSV